MPLALVTRGANRLDKSPTSIAADGGDGAFSPHRQPEVGGSIPTRGNSSPPDLHFFFRILFSTADRKITDVQRNAYFKDAQCFSFL
jgi:hypothetical protein